MKNERSTLSCAILFTLPMLAHSNMVFADNAVENGKETPSELPAINVTADKTERPLEAIPASVSMIDGLDIKQSGIVTMEQLEGRVPGLSFQPFGQAGMNSPVMRGLTANFNTFSTSTLLLVDGVPTLTAQGFEDSFLDVDRVEVLRGPQSTLYGRNAEAGVIAIHSLPMDNIARASASVEIANRDKRAIRFSLSQPLVEDRLYASISGSSLEQDGFIDNIFTGRKEDDRQRRHLKLGVRWTPSAATDLVLRYAHQDYDDGAALWGAPTSPRQHVASGTEGWNQSSGQTLSLKASHTFASGLQLHSITAWNDFRDDIQQDTDFMPAEVMHIRRDHHLSTLSQELRLDGKMGDSDWLAGVYADRGANDLRNVGQRMRQQEDLRADQKSRTFALFTHWNMPLTDIWSLMAGARVERSAVEIQPQGALTQKRDWTHFSPKLALQYQFNPQHQWYASASHGIRTGGFNALSAATNYAAFAPETNWSYETGFKGWSSDKRLRYSLAVYFMDIDDMQVMQMPVPGFMYITSAATARSKGVELDMDYLLGDGWQLKAGLAWNRTNFDHFQDGDSNYAGNRNPFAPDLTGHIGIRYDALEGWYAQASVRGSSNVYLDAANQHWRNGYGLIDLVTGYQRGNWEISAYANNVADKTYDAVGYQNGFVTVYSPPREVGLRLAWRL
ncbi:TonB-dependent receptor [Vreelandella alkaliphila]|uniref:TonB-dependent receptor n=1 Tax=Halomonadaceae TaxID=28256 RepID=UPI001D03010B|nr:MULTISPECIES: TonB-dependent receptor [unclassified Halomonas]